MRRLGYLTALWLAGMAQSSVVAAPPTLDKPGRRVRFLSLPEARAIALEHGRIGQPSLLFPGVGLDSSITAPQGGESNSHSPVVCKPGSKCLIVTGVTRDPEHVRNIDQMLLNVETAYWNLYGSYWQLYSREEGLRLAYETWKIAQAKCKEGKLSQADVANAEGQYNLFRSQRLAALDTVLDNERQLRAMLGMHIKDSTRLAPSDAPTLVEQRPDWKAGLRSTMKKRPELQMARQDVRSAAWKVEKAEETPPIVRAGGVASTSDSGVRQAAFQLQRAQLVLQDQELKAERYLGLWYRRMSSAYFQIKAARAQCEAFATQLSIRDQLYRADEPGTNNSVSLNLLLEAQRFWAEALATECQAIVTYNNALVGWEYAKGDVMKHAHVRLVAEAPDGSDVVRAVDREHKRTRQYVCRVPGMLGMAENGHRVPVWGVGECEGKKAASSLPALWKFYPPLKDAGDLETGLVEGRVFD